jgi:hypothetical protein
VHKKIHNFILLLLISSSYALLQKSVGAQVAATKSKHPFHSSVSKPKISSPLLFMSDFEQGDLAGWSKEVCCSDSVRVVKDPVRSGTSAVRFYLRKDDPDVMNSRRSELALQPIPTNSERWYGFSIFLPDNWATDPTMEIVAQWHEYPDFSLGETWRSPPLSLSTLNGSWHVGRRWDPNPLTKKNTLGLGGGIEDIKLESYKIGVWTDWVFHIKWSYKADGLLEIWKDKNLIVRRNGPNTYNDQVGPYFKIGVYKPDWKYNPQKSTIKTRIVYFDEVRIGDNNITYADIAPHLFNVDSRKKR